MTEKLEDLKKKAQDADNLLIKDMYPDEYAFAINPKFINFLARVLLDNMDEYKKLVKPVTQAIEQEEAKKGRKLTDEEFKILVEPYDEKNNYSGKTREMLKECEELIKKRLKIAIDEATQKVAEWIMEYNQNSISEKEFRKE